MKNWNEFSRVPLGVFPTPLYKLEKLSREVGKNIYIKRDDLTGVALGGNKVRKLEFLLADAQNRGVDTVLTTGGPQSNHAMLTAACAARLGMSAILVLKGQTGQEKGNLVLDHLYGAQVRFVDGDSYDPVYAEMDAIMEGLKEEGHVPYAIPVGGSVPLGCLGYVRCVEEVARQCEALEMQPDVIVSTAGSGGTYAGVTLGAKRYLPGIRSIGMAVGTTPLEQVVPDLMEGTARLMEWDVPVERADIEIVDCMGSGYAIPSPEGAAAIRRLARTEGILADPVYTGKALAGLFQMLEQGRFDGQENIIFLHTGGAGALFALELPGQ